MKNQHIRYDSYYISPINILMHRLSVWEEREPSVRVYPINGEPELTDPFNLLINLKLRML